MTRYIDDKTIEDIALGAAVLGTGGGGDPHIGSLLAKSAIKKNAPVPVLSLDEIPDEMMVAPSSMIGAPTVAVEKIMSAQQMVTAFNKLEQVLEQPLGATFPIEVGGLNSLIPFLTAAYKGIPVIDCDAMGRAFPESQMVTFYLDGLPSAPNTMADEKGNVIVLYPVDGIWSERFARDITMQMGASTAMSDYPMRGKQLKQSAIGGTLTLAETLGRTLREAHQSGVSGLQSVLDIVSGHPLAFGKITDVERVTSGGFSKGKLIIEGLGPDKGEHFHILFQNELLVAYRANHHDCPTAENLLAVTPDLISILDHETGFPITTEQFRYGQRIDVIAYPCHQKWRTPKGIEVAGPGYFGYAVEYQPIEQLIRQ
ncbi:MAG: DUF917 domain-containing protein [Enterobacteriaceae bacterium]